MLTSNELELKVNLLPGSFESNAEQLREFAMQRLKDYTPEKYEGKIAEAKADRAELNNAEKLLNSRRLELEREYMQPFNNFKSIITDTCKAIKQASGKLDEIVKGEEEREKNVKREKIENYFERQNFTLFTLDKIFDDKWLNKTTKEKDVYAAIDARIKQALDDLKVLDNFPAEDIPLLKTVYLETLSITEAMNKAQLLKDNRDRLAREKAEREALETRDALRKQEQDEVEEQKSQNENISDLVNQALGITPDEPEEKQEYALVLKGTKEALLNVREYMTSQSVTYIKLARKSDGVFVAE